MKTAQLIAVLFGMTSMLSAVSLGMAYVSVDLWGSAAREYLGLAFIIALLASIIATTAMKFLRWPRRHDEIGATT